MAMVEEWMEGEKVTSIRLSQHHRSSPSPSARELS
uniref:Uncharacterized protein n=1 Tax=Anguilla anguilla TaxID=7936 RepID=A0A0E9PL49_ANGAN